MDKIIKNNRAWNYCSVALQIVKQVQKIFLLVMNHLTKFDDVV